MSETLRLTATLSALNLRLEPLDGARPVDPPNDLFRLGELLLDAYHAASGDPKSVPADEQVAGADALEAVDGLLSGTYGTFDAEASELVEREGRVVTATLVTTPEGGPLVAIAMTHPTWQRRGLAGASVARAMARLAGRGETSVDALVTDDNERALALFRSLGFAERP